MKEPVHGCEQFSNESKPSLHEESALTSGLYRCVVYVIHIAMWAFQFLYAWWFDPDEWGDRNIIFKEKRNS